jgi:hypothetical protein
MSARRFPIVTASKLRRFLLVGASEVDSEALRTLGVMGRRRRFRSECGGTTDAHFTWSGDDTFFT